MNWNYKLKIIKQNVVFYTNLSYQKTIKGTFLLTFIIQVYYYFCSLQYGDETYVHCQFEDLCFKRVVDKIVT